MGKSHKICLFATMSHGCEGYSLTWIKLESVNLSATNETFVTKGELESNFLTILTDKPKLNHWLDTLLN